MNKSSERPWRSEYSGFPQLEDIFSGNLRVCRVRGNNASRIVASVNACSVISVEALEDGVIRDLIEGTRMAVLLLGEIGTSNSKYSDEAVGAMSFCMKALTKLSGISVSKESGKGE